MTPSPSTRKRTVLSWSSGKDSAWALWQLLQDPSIQVTQLLTTVNQIHDRVAMHAVRRRLLHEQARAAGIPLVEVELPWPCPNEEYEARMGHAVERLREQGNTHMAFGDLFLEDIRQYRETKLAGTGLTPLFPLWGRDTRMLARQMVAGGLVAHLTTVDPKQLDPSFVGRRFDAELLRELPPGVDPCGENGEFHSFVSAGPMFERTLPVRVGDIVERDGFYFADLLPA